MYSYLYVEIYVHTYIVRNGQQLCSVYGMVYVCTYVRMCIQHTFLPPDTSLITNVCILVCVDCARTNCWDCTIRTNIGDFMLPFLAQLGTRVNKYVRMSVFV